MSLQHRFKFANNNHADNVCFDNIFRANVFGHDSTECKTNITADMLKLLREDPPFEIRLCKPVVETPEVFTTQSVEPHYHFSWASWKLDEKK